MRLLFVSMLFPDQRRPTRAMFNFRHVGAIRDLGHEVQVMVPLKTLPGAARLGLAPRLPDREEFAGFQVWHPPFHHLPVVGRHLQHRFYRRSVRQRFAAVVHEFQPDHVLIGFAYPDGAAVGPLCEELGVPWSIAVLGSDFYVRVRQRLVRQVVLDTLRAAPIVFCPGQALRDAMVAAGIPSRQIVDFRNGVLVDIFKPVDEAREPYVLFVGNLVPIKGVDRLLEAWARLDRTDLILRLVGGGHLADQMRALSRRLGIADRIEFLPPQAPTEVARQMQHACLLCLPSHSEGMPNVVLEALACGTPVVGSDVGEIPYLVEDGRNGFVFAGGEDAVANLRAALDKALAATWDHATIAAGVRGFTWQKAAETVVDAIGAVASAPDLGGDGLDARRRR